MKRGSPTSRATLTRARNSTASSESNPQFGQRDVTVDRQRR